MKSLAWTGCRQAAALVKEQPAVILLNLHLPDSREEATFHRVVRRSI
jgi:hypothetical protein